MTQAAKRQAAKLGGSEGAPLSATDDEHPLSSPHNSVPLSDSGSVTVAALVNLLRLLVNLLRLMGAELVLAQPGCETERFENAVRTKIQQFVSPNVSAEAREAGLRFAQYLVEQVLSQIRAQARIKRSLTPPASRQGRSSNDKAEEAKPPRLLN
jgi:hypothetical protein